MPVTAVVILTLAQGTEYVWVLAASALAPVALLRLIGRASAWGLSVVLVNVGLATWAWPWRSDGVSPLVAVSGVASGAALGWSLLALIGGRTPEGNGGSHQACLASAARLSAIWCGVLASVILIYLLVIRAVEIALEVWHGAPLPSALPMGFGWSGLWMIGGLALACATCLAVLRDARLITPVLWLGVMAVCWTAAVLPTYVYEANGGIARTPLALAVLVGLAVLLAGSTWGQGRARRIIRWRAATSGQVLDTRQHAGRAALEWPGFRRSAGVLGIVLVLLTCLQAAVPPDSVWLSARMAAGVAAACAAVGSVTYFHLVSWRWSGNLADLAMGLATLAVSAAVVAFSPIGGSGLDAGFPMVFNAWVVGLAVMSGTWVWLGRVWTQQLDDGLPWTAAGRLSGLAVGFAFFTSCLATALGALMAIWPRLRPIGVADDSLGRVASGVAAHLLLILVLLRNGRAARRGSYVCLTILAALSLVGFVLVRAAPLTSSVMASVRG